MSVPVGLAGVWLLAGVAAFAIGIRAMVRAFTSRPLSDNEAYCAAIDDDLRTGRSVLVTYDDAADAIADAVMEDAEVDWLERLYYEVPAAVKR